MRKPRVKRVPRSSEFPKGVAYFGAVRGDGRDYWVSGKYSTVAAWERAARARLTKALAEANLDRSTVGRFANLTADEDDRVVPLDPERETWPKTHQRGGLKDSSIRRYQEGLRPFVRAFEEREFGSVGALEAREWAYDMGAHTVEACRRFFADAQRDELFTGRNPFEGLTNKKIPRVRQPDYVMISDEEYAAILIACTVAEGGDYGKVVAGMATLMGEMAIRPGEMYALEWRDIDWANRTITIRQTVDDRGVITPTKNALRRAVPMTSTMGLALQAMPRLSERWVFPAPRGGLWTNSNFSAHWKAIRTGARITRDCRWYDLKHRALTRLVTPMPDGLGLDVQTAAVIAGHQDGGITLAKHYLRMDERLAIARVAAAADRFDQAQKTRLRAV